MKREAEGADGVGMIEAAYRLDLTPDAWLAELARALLPLLGDGLGIDGYRFESVPDLAITGRVTVGSNIPPFDSESVLAALAPDERALYRQQFLAPRHFSVAHAFGRDRTASVNKLFGLDSAAKDVLTLLLPLEDGTGCIFCCSRRAPVALTPAGTKRIARVGAHILAAARLRQVSSRPPEAILDADGRILHAEPAAQSGSAREQLRASARAIDRARGKLRRTRPDEAMGLWRGLVAGRWSLVDRFDTDGRRFVVAQRNDPTVRQLRALTPRESQVVAHAAAGLQLKLVAYTLGLPLGTVATALDRALAKLGMSSRADLATLAAVLRDVEEGAAGEEAEGVDLEP